MSTHSRFPVRRLLTAGLCACALLVSATASAADWQAQRYGGGQITVDPDTNRATLNRNGVRTPLWDGVHRLEDGTSLTVRSGVVVPNKGIIEARRLPDVRDEADAVARGEWDGRSIIGYSPCQQLVRRVCGSGQECADMPACAPAQQLLEMEWQERRASQSAGMMTFTSGQCLQAARDPDFFVSCAPSLPDPLASP